MYQARKEAEEATARGGGAAAAAPADPPDEKPLAVKKEEPDPEVRPHTLTLHFTLYLHFTDNKSQIFSNKKIPKG